MTKASLWQQLENPLTGSIFIVVTEVCVDGPAELQNVIPLVLIHPLVLGLLWERKAQGVAVRKYQGGGFSSPPRSKKYKNKS